MATVILVFPRSQMCLVSNVVHLDEAYSPIALQTTEKVSFAIVTSARLQPPDYINLQPPSHFSPHMTSILPIHTVAGMKLSFRSSHVLLLLQLRLDLVQFQICSVTWIWASHCSSLPRTLHGLPQRGFSKPYQGNSESQFRHRSCCPLSR